MLWRAGDLMGWIREGKLKLRIFREMPSQRRRRRTGCWKAVRAQERPLDPLRRWKADPSLRVAVSSNFSNGRRGSMEKVSPPQAHSTEYRVEKPRVYPAHLARMGRSPRGRCAGASSLSTEWGSKWSSKRSTGRARAAREGAAGGARRLPSDGRAACRMGEQRSVVWRWP